MRRNSQNLKTGRALAMNRFRSNDELISQRTQHSTNRHSSRGRVLSLDRWRPNFEESVDEELSSALVAQDKELASVLNEVERISKAIKSEAPNTEILASTLERTVLCAVKQSLLDRELRSLELRVNRRKGQGLLLFFADVDHLKDINDVYGHREGDLALVRTADALEKTFRNSDVIARLGGDEFAVLALEASRENREVILRRLEKNLKIANAEETRYELSLSVGMSKFDPRHPATLGKLIAQADEAMYEEKRNRPALA